MSALFFKKDEKTLLSSLESEQIRGEGLPLAGSYASQAGKMLFSPYGDAIAEELQKLLDEHHIQRWGLKEYRRHIDLEIRPSLARENLYSLKDGRLNWTYSDAPLFKKMENDFYCALCERSLRRSCLGPEWSQVEAWRAHNAVEASKLHVDLLYISRYDYQAYAHFPQSPNDVWGYSNSDRFFFVYLPEEKVWDVHALLEMIGKMHLHIHELSCVLMPGLAEKDSNGLDGPFSLVFVTQQEQAARGLQRQMKLFGRSLVSPSKTLEVWGLSMEALRAFPNKENAITDLLSKAGHAVYRIG